MELFEDARPGQNAPEFTVSEISGAVKRVLEGEFGRVRVRGEVGRVTRHASGHIYLRSQGRDRLPRLGRLPLRRAAAAHPAAGRHGGRSPPGASRPSRRPSKYQLIVDEIAPAGVGALMAMLEAAQEGAGRRGPVRRRPQAPAALSARGHRRRHLALGRGHPRHPAPPARAVPAPRADLAGDRAGRALRPRGRRRHPRLQRHPPRRPGAAPRPPHRRARRRQPRGPLGLQRGDRRPRRRREPHPADLGRRPRDRHHAHRLRRRPARPDADRRRRDGGAGAARPARRHRRARAPAAERRRAPARPARPAAARPRARAAAAARR